MCRCSFSDPAGSRELVPPRLFSLRGVLQGSGWGAFHRGPSQQHLLRGRLQQVRLGILLKVGLVRYYARLYSILFIRI